jgi:hypothetical protein
MDFISINHINELFVSGKLSNLPDNITIGNIPYHIRKSISYPIPSMIKKNLKAFVVYAITGEHPIDFVKSQEDRHHAGFLLNKKSKELDEWIILIWAITPNLVIAPARAIATSAARGEPLLSTAERGQIVDYEEPTIPAPVRKRSRVGEGNQNVIPDQVDVTIKRFGRNVKAKTDTGANMSSFHVDNWKYLPGNDRVEFKSNLLSNNLIQMDCLNQVVVQTAEGTEYRPVIAFDISINGKDINKAQFNLNNRSGMKDQVLIGQNILERGKFLVDPTQQINAIRSEEFEINWDVLQERFRDVKVEGLNENLSEEDTKQLYEMLLNSNLSFRDIMQHLKTIAY